jgi:hypothetical protein
MNENRTATDYREKTPNGTFTLKEVKGWMLWAVGLFLLASIFGTLMRLYYLVEIPLLEYVHILHAHSHVAQLGWGFLLVTLALIFLGLSSTPHKRHYKAVLVLNVVACFGMAAAFLIQSYGPVSIAFSMFHLFIAYYFAYWFWKDIQRVKSSVARVFYKGSVIWLVLSTLGLWVLPIVLQTAGKTSIFYYTSIQWFLHLQFNGWFTYAVLGLLVSFLSKRGVELHIPNSVWACLHLSVLLTYALSVSWGNPHPLLFYLNGLGVILQLFAIGYILLKLKIGRKYFQQGSVLAVSLIGLGVFSLILKILMQSALVLPDVAQISHTIRNFVIGFIHLTMLGSISLTTVGLLIREGALPEGVLAHIGWFGVIIAFLSTELLLFIQGLWVWLTWGYFSIYYELLFSVTAIFPLSIFLFFLGFVTKKPYYITKSKFNV